MVNRGGEVESARYIAEAIQENRPSRIVRSRNKTLFFTHPLRASQTDEGIRNKIYNELVALTAETLAELFRSASRAELSEWDYLMLQFSGKVRDTLILPDTILDEFQTTYERRIRHFQAKERMGSALETADTYRICDEIGRWVDIAYVYELFYLERHLVETYREDADIVLAFKNALHARIQKAWMLELARESSRNHFPLRGYFVYKYFPGLAVEYQAARKQVYEPIREEKSAQRRAGNEGFEQYAGLEYKLWKYSFKVPQNMPAAWGYFFLDRLSWEYGRLAVGYDDHWQIRSTACEEPNMLYAFLHDLEIQDLKVLQHILEDVFGEMYEMESKFSGYDVADPVTWPLDVVLGELLEKYYFDPDDIERRSGERKISIKGDTRSYWYNKGGGGNTKSLIGLEKLCESIIEEESWDYVHLFLPYRDDLYGLMCVILDYIQKYSGPAEARQIFFKDFKRHCERDGKEQKPQRVPEDACRMLNEKYGLWLDANTIEPIYQETLRLISWKEALLRPKWSSESGIQLSLIDPYEYVAGNKDFLTDLEHKYDEEKAVEDHYYAFINERELYENEKGEAEEKVRADREDYLDAMHIYMDDKGNPLSKRFIARMALDEYTQFSWLALKLDVSEEYLRKIAQTRLWYISNVLPYRDATLLVRFVTEWKTEVYALKKVLAQDKKVWGQHRIPRLHEVLAETLGHDHVVVRQKDHRVHQSAKYVDQSPDFLYIDTKHLCLSFLLGYCNWDKLWRPAFGLTQEWGDYAEMLADMFGMHADIQREQMHAFVSSIERVVGPKNGLTTNDVYYLIEWWNRALRERHITYEDAPQSTFSMDAVLATFFAGMDAENRFVKLDRYLKETFGREAHILADLLAITSQISDIKNNVTAACQLYYDYLQDGRELPRQLGLKLLQFQRFQRLLIMLHAGETTIDYTKIDAIDDEAVRAGYQQYTYILEYEEMWEKYAQNDVFMALQNWSRINWPKITAFSRTMRGDDTAIVIDMRLQRMFKVWRWSAPTESEYQGMADVVTLLAVIKWCSARDMHAILRWGMRKLAWVPDDGFDYVFLMKKNLVRRQRNKGIEEAVLEEILV